MLKEGVQNLGAPAYFPKGEGFPTGAGPSVLPRSWFLSQGGALPFFSHVPNLLVLRIPFPGHASVLVLDRASHFAEENESLRLFPSDSFSRFHTASFTHGLRGHPPSRVSLLFTAPLFLPVSLSSFQATSLLNDKME